MRRFLVCIHDATPAHDGATRTMLGDLAPLVGRRLSMGVVPNWQGVWPLAAHIDYCRLVENAAEELLLHGYFHRRQRGWGPASLLAEGSDEMNGLDDEETGRVIARGQRDFTDVFGAPARGFLAPAWQQGHLNRERAETHGIEYVLGFFALQSCTGRRIPLATCTWDCGRWSWLGHVGHAVGTTLRALGHGTPVLAIHPRDLMRGYWPTILRLVHELLDAGYEPATPSSLLEATHATHRATRHAEVAV